MTSNSTAEAPALTAEDFPLRAEGSYVFARTRKLPILIAIDPRMAEEITRQLNNASEDFVTIPRMR